jgi:hypothetical protein
MTSKHRLLTDKPKDSISPKAQSMADENKEEFVFGGDPEGWDASFLASAAGYESYDTFTSSASSNGIFSVKSEVLRKSSNASQKPKKNDKEDTTCCPSWFPKW